MEGEGSREEESNDHFVPGTSWSSMKATSDLFTNYQPNEYDELNSCTRSDWTQGISR